MYINLILQIQYLNINIYYQKMLFILMITNIVQHHIKLIMVIMIFKYLIMIFYMIYFYIIQMEKKLQLKKMINNK